MNRFWTLLLLGLVALLLLFYFTRSRRLNVDPHAADEIEKAKRH